VFDCNTSHYLNHLSYFIFNAFTLERPPDLFQARSVTIVIVQL